MFHDTVAKTESFNKTHNPYIHIATEASLEKQHQEQEGKSGVLSGFMLCVKDNLEVAGMPHTAGTAALKGGVYVPEKDAATVTRLRNAGALISGKTNLHELAYGITTNNFAFGPTGNAVRPDHIAGGSSGGTAVAIALDTCRAGLGTDTGGSSRIPAALNGIVGFRPTVGRYPAAGMTSISTTRDTVGPMARTVADVALLDAVLADEDTSAPLAAAPLSTIKLGVPREYFYDNLDPAVAAVTTSALEKLAAAGVTLVEANIEDIGKLDEAVSFPVVLYETSKLLPEFVNSIKGSVNPAGAITTVDDFADKIASPDVQGVVKSALSGAIPEGVYNTAVNEARPKLQAAYKAYFEKHQVDAIIYPTTPLPARPIENSVETVELNGEQVPTFPTYIRNTDPSSNAGICSISVPAGLTGETGLPVGVCLDGAAGNDRRLLAVALAIEKNMQ